MNFALVSRSTRAAEGLPRRRFTVADVEAMVVAGIMDEDERIELIGGELVPMSAKGIQHETIKGELNQHWCRVCPAACRLIPETTFRITEDTFLEPDFVIYPAELGLADLSPTNVLLVVEIGDSSLSYDRGRKADLYGRCGVRELWVIDAVKAATRIFRNPSAEGYAEALDFAEDGLLTPAFAPAEFMLRLSELRRL